MKRRDERKRSRAEQRLDNSRHLNAVERDAMKQSRVNPIFTERPYYGIPEPGKEVVNVR